MTSSQMILKLYHLFNQSSLDSYRSFCTRRIQLLSPICSDKFEMSKHSSNEPRSNLKFIIRLRSLNLVVSLWLFMWGLFWDQCSIITNRMKFSNYFTDTEIIQKNRLSMRCSTLSQVKCIRHMRQHSSYLNNTHEIGVWFNLIALQIVYIVV